MELMIAKIIKNNPKIECVNYPWSEIYPGYDILIISSKVLTKK